MLLQLILALAATAANGFVIPQNITTGSVQPLYERTPLPPHVPGLHILVTDNDINTYSASDMAIFLKAHNQALDMCAMVIDQATRATRRFDRIFRRWFAEEDQQKVLGQSSAHARLDVRRLTFCRCFHEHGWLH
jgi:hypothetical protein